MKPEQIRRNMVHAVTDYDRKQEAKAAKNPRRHSHNVHALGIYLGRVDDVMADIEAGATVHAAIVAGFTGPLRTRVLKEFGMKADHTETGTITYQPASR